MLLLVPVLPPLPMRRRPPAARDEGGAVVVVGPAAANAIAGCVWHLAGPPPADELAPVASSENSAAVKV